MRLPGSTMVLEALISGMKHWWKPDAIWGIERVRGLLVLTCSSLHCASAFDQLGSVLRKWPELPPQCRWMFGSSCFDTHLKFIHRNNLASKKGEKRENTIKNGCLANWYRIRKRLKTSSVDQFGYFVVFSSFLPVVFSTPAATSEFRGRGSLPRCMRRLAALLLALPQVPAIRSIQSQRKV